MYTWFIAFFYLSMFCEKKNCFLSLPPAVVLISVMLSRWLSCWPVLLFFFHLLICMFLFPRLTTGCSHSPIRKVLRILTSSTKLLTWLTPDFLTNRVRVGECFFSPGRSTCQPYTRQCDVYVFCLSHLFLYHVLSINLSLCLLPMYLQHVII